MCGPNLLDQVTGREGRKGRAGITLREEPETKVAVLAALATGSGDICLSEPVPQASDAKKQPSISAADGAEWDETFTASCRASVRGVCGAREG